MIKAFPPEDRGDIDPTALIVPSIYLMESGNWTDRTRWTRAVGSFRIEYQLGARGRCDLEIRDYDSFQTALRAKLDQSVVVHPWLFNGAVFNVNDVPLGDPGVGTVTRLQAMDNWRFAARRRVKETLVPGYYLWDVVHYVVDNYLAPFGLQVDPAWDRATNPGPILGELVFDYSTVEDVFNRLAVLTGWIYRLHPTGYVQMFPIGGKARAITFSAANNNIIGPVEWTQSVGTFANRIILRYGTGLVDRTEAFVGDGVRRSWPLAYPLAEVGWIRYPGVIDQEQRTQSWPGEGAPSSIAGGCEFYQTDYPALQEYQNTWPSSASLNPPLYGFPVWWGPSSAGGVDWWWDPLNHSLVHYQSFPYDSSNPGLGNITPASRTVTIAPYLALEKEGVGEAGVSSLWRWHYDATLGPYGSIVNDLPDPLRAGLEFTFDYKVQFPLVVTVEDAADIAVHGIFEELREEPQIFDLQAATDFANGLLRKQTLTPRTATITTRVAQDFLPGDTVQLDVPARTLPSSHWLVTEVTLSAEADQNLTARLALLEGTEAQASWIDFWRNMLGSGSGSPVGIASGSVIPGTGGGVTSVTTWLPATAGRITKWQTTDSITDSALYDNGHNAILCDNMRFVVSSPTPQLGLYEIDEPEGQRLWYWGAATQVVQLQAADELGNVLGVPLSITRGGIVAAPFFQGDGRTLINLNATQLTMGALPFARVPLSGASRLLGRGSSAAGPMEEITLGTGLTMTGTVLSASGGGGAPGAHATTHNTGGSDPLTALSASILTSGTVPDARLSVNVLKFTGGYPGGTANFLRADGTFSAPPGGTIPGAHATTHQTGGADVVDVKRLGGYPGDSVVFLNGLGAFTAVPAAIPVAHATSHNTGGGDPLTALSAAILTTGTLADARLTVNVLKFTGGYPGGTTTFLRADGTFAIAGGGAPAAHATTHNTGGSDPLTALSASILTSGTLPNARVTVNPAALLGRSNTATGPMEEITLGGNLSMTGNVLNAATAGISGGVANWLPKWTGATTLGVAEIMQDSANFHFYRSLRVYGGYVYMDTQSSPGIYITELGAATDQKSIRVVLSGGGLYFQSLSEGASIMYTPLVVNRSSCSLNGTTALSAYPGQWGAICYGADDPSSWGFLIYAGKSAASTAFAVSNRSGAIAGFNISGDMVVNIPNRLVIPVGANAWAPQMAGVGTYLDYGKPAN